MSATTALNKGRLRNISSRAAKIFCAKNYPRQSNKIKGGYKPLNLENGSFVNSDILMPPT